MEKTGEVVKAATRIKAVEEKKRRMCMSSKQRGKRGKKRRGGQLSRTCIVVWLILVFCRSGFPYNTHKFPSSSP